ncbi:MAG: T9SS type A sorting domain-containing protein [Phycisphaerae bacterium]|nr:T9SS type A sorting domain-containing protein [Saprospiraceae bacterium]
MKKIALCLTLVGIAGFLSAQTLGLDAIFGVNGKVVTGLNGISGSPYGIDFVGLPDGEIMIGGSLADYVGLEKYDNAGALDPMFSTSLIASDGLEVGVAVQKDGKVLLAAENPVGLSTFVARMDAFGKLDPSFGNGGIAQTSVTHFWVHNVFVQSDGKVVVFGDEWTNFSSFSAVRFLSNGTLDSSFATNGKLSIDLPDYTYEVPIAMLEQPDHKLLFVGTIRYFTGNVLLVRINPDGTRDDTFGEGGLVIDPIEGNSSAYALALQPDGKILLTGDTGPNPQAIVARYLSDGTRDLGFGNEGVQYLPELYEGVGIAVFPDGKILTANWSTNATLGNLALAQLLPNGQRDQAFGDNGVFRIINPGMHPRALSLIGNKATVSARKLTGTNQKQLFRFLLDLNVGTLNPNNSVEPSLWVYPNPIAEQFTLKFGLTQKEQVGIHLFDMNGKQVQSFVQNQSFEQGEHEINLFCADHLAAGNYALSLEVAGKKLSSIQIVKR